MKALILHQPYATLVAIGVKQWETRNGPPNGSMRPAGVRGMPGLGIEPGERIAIVAAQRRPTEGLRLGPQTQVVTQEYLVDGGRLLDLCNSCAYPLPLGRVVCTAGVAEAVPIGGPFAPIQGAHIETDGKRLQLVTVGHAGWLGRKDFTDQLPYGDWQPGRWAWRLTDVVQVDGPVEVVRGNRQGVFEAAVTWCFLCFMKAKAELERKQR